MRNKISDGAGGFFWVPTDDNTGLDGSERPTHGAPRAPRASTSTMLRMVSQARYQAPQAPVHWHTINQAGARVLCTPNDRAPGCDAPQARPPITRAARLPDPGTCLRRLADSVKLQDDGATSGP